MKELPRLSFLYTRARNFSSNLLLLTRTVTLISSCIAFCSSLGQHLCLAWRIADHPYKFAQTFVYLWYMEQDQYLALGKFLRFNEFVQAYTVITRRSTWYYRTLYSYNSSWAVCHLFPQQRWRIHTNNQSRETIGQENHVTCVKLRPHKFCQAFFGADSKTHIFYKYIVFKYSFSFTHFPLQRQHTPSSVTLFHQQTSKSNNMDGPRKHLFLQNTLTKSASETLTVSNLRKKWTF